jgi:hypothetical protein
MVCVFAAIVAVLLFIDCFGKPKVARGAEINDWVAKENSVEKMIDAEISHSIADGDCINFSKVLSPETKGYFKKVFSSEEEKQDWLKRILGHANRHNRNLEVEVSIVPLELSLETEDTISLDSQHSGVVYIFYGSGKITCARSYGNMSAGSYSVKGGHFGTFGPVR